MATGLLRRCVVLGLLLSAAACYVFPYTPLYVKTIGKWDHERGDLACYYALWVALDTSLVLAAVVSAGEDAQRNASPSKVGHHCLAQCSRRFTLVRRLMILDSMWLLVPRISQISAYCRLVSPPPARPAASAESTGRNRFQRPCAFASFFRDVCRNC